jgi:hypothetical protein
MFKIKSEIIEDAPFMMKDLKPCEIAVIVDNVNDYYGEIVMRTANDSAFEVMSLSKPGRNRCWTMPTIKILVKKLKKNDEITLVVT